VHPVDVDHALSSTGAMGRVMQVHLDRIRAAAATVPAGEASVRRADWNGSGSVDWVSHDSVRATKLMQQSAAALTIQSHARRKWGLAWRLLENLARQQMESHHLAQQRAARPPRPRTAWSQREVRATALV
jgi:hypothetical protein